MGFVITAKPGDWVEQGAISDRLRARFSGIEIGRAALREALTIADEASSRFTRLASVTMGGMEAYES